MAETRPAERDDKRPRGARDQRGMREGGAINEFLEGFLPMISKHVVQFSDFQNTNIQSQALNKQSSDVCTGEFEQEAVQTWKRIRFVIENRRVAATFPYFANRYAFS